MKQTDYTNIGQVEVVDDAQHPHSPSRITRYHSNGLTKREWFAGIAMTLVKGEDAKARAVAAIEHADALIAELGKK